MKTYSAKPVQVDHQWYQIDASGQTLGRLASVIATHLQGKHKPIYTAHIDCGDNVVVTNAAQIKVTGAKLSQKNYYHHSGYPGGLSEIKLSDQLAKDPTKVIEAAVRGMLPKNKLAAERMKRLKVYPTSDHPHFGQTPRQLELNDGRN